MIVSFLLSIILLGLGIIHFYWALGGKKGLEKTIPVKGNGEKLFIPKVIDSLVVGLGLVIFGIYYFLRFNSLGVELPNWIIRYVGWIIPMIFILRAIGDFKYIGFGEKIKNTNFGKCDTQFYSPLCLGIGFLGIFVQIL